MKSEWIRSWRPPERLGVGLLCLLFACSLGVHYGVSDQNTYLLSGLRMAAPSFLAGDWFASETVHHHAAFTYLIYLLQGMGPLPWTSAVFYLLFKTLLAFSAYVILRALYDRPFLPFLFSLIILYMAVGNTSILSHPFFVPWLLPAGIASTLFLAGVAALSCAAPMPSRCALAGALFGLSGLFHGTFLFMIPLFLGGVWVALPRRFSRREIIAFLVPFLVLTLPSVWSVLVRFDLGEHAVERLDALLRFRAPHHYLPRNWGTAGFALFAGHAALGIIGLLMRWPRTPGSPVVLAAAASLSGLFILVCFCTLILFIPQVAMLEPFHFVALLSCFGLLFFAGAVAKEVESQGDAASRLRRLILLGLGLLVTCWTNRIVGLVLVILIIPCLIAARVRFFGQGPKFAPRFLPWGTLLFLTGLTGFCFPLSTAFFSPYGADYALCRWVRSHTPPQILATLLPFRPESDLYRWIRAATPQDARFVAPLKMDRFRLNAGRSIVVDWKGFPYRLQDSEEWYRRIATVSGTSNPVSQQEVVQGYLSLDAERARALARTFDVQYVVVVAPQHLGDLSTLDKVYENALFRVYRIPSDSPPSPSSATQPGTGESENR